MSSDGKDIHRVVGGLKAAIHNPHVSEEAKHHAEKRIEQIEGKESKESDDSEHHHRVLGGYKATLKNPNVSEEAKDRAAQVLSEERA